MTERQYVRRRMTQTFDICHLLAHLRGFAFLIHEERVKLTTKLTKDTKNLLTAAHARLSHNCNLAAIVPIL